MGKEIGGNPNWSDKQTTGRKANSDSWKHCEAGKGVERQVEGVSAFGGNELAGERRRGIMDDI